MVVLIRVKMEIMRKKKVVVVVVVVGWKRAVELEEFLKLTDELPEHGQLFFHAPNNPTPPSSSFGPLSSFCVCVSGMSFGLARPRPQLQSKPKKRKRDEKQANHTACCCCWLWLWLGLGLASGASGLCF